MENTEEPKPSNSAHSFTEGSKGICVSCDQEKEVYELCLECAVKLGHDNPKPTAVAEPVKAYLVMIPMSNSNIAIHGAFFDEDKAYRFLGEAKGFIHPIEIL